MTAHETTTNGRSDRGEQPAPSPERTRLFAAVAGLTTVTVFAQAVLAGQFVSQHGKAGWISAHNVVATVVVVLSLITAVVAWRDLRHQAPALWKLATVLFVATVIQTGIGHAITDGGVKGLIGVHVPLAFAIFALATWLSVQAALLRHGHA